MITTKIEVNAPVETFWKVITDLEKYPEFQKDLKKVAYKTKDGNKYTVYHEIVIMQPVNYTLAFEEVEKNKKLVWKLLDVSEVKLPIPFTKPFKAMEKNEGWWDLVSLGPDKCEATYNLDIKLNSKIPSMITDPLMKSSLPKMMDAFKKRAESLK